MEYIMEYDYYKIIIYKFEQLNNFNNKKNNKIV